MRCALGLALALVSLAAGAQTADRPVIRAGDRWSFVVWYTVPSTTPNRHWVVTRVTGERIEATENGEPLALTPDLNALETPLVRESNPGALRFPLEIGKRWSFRSDWLFKPKGSTGHGATDVEVLAYEKVRVPAGEFDAFKLRSSTRLSGESPIGSVYDGDRIVTYWYAPAARAVVKSVAHNPYLGPSTVELVEHRPQ
jgi:hypothetical protein